MDPNRQFVAPQNMGGNNNFPGMSSQPQSMRAGSMQMPSAGDNEQGGPQFPNNNGAPQFNAAPRSSNDSTAAPQMPPTMNNNAQFKLDTDGLEIKDEDSRLKINSDSIIGETESIKTTIDSSGINIKSKDN